MTSVYAQRRARPAQLGDGSVAIIPGSPGCIAAAIPSICIADGYFYYLTGFSEPSMPGTDQRRQSVLFCRPRIWSARSGPAIAWAPGGQRPNWAWLRAFSSGKSISPPAAPVGKTARRVWFRCHPKGPGQPEPRSKAGSSQVRAARLWRALSHARGDACALLDEKCVWSGRGMGRTSCARAAQSVQAHVRASLAFRPA